MTIWIKKQDGEIADDYVFAAYLGFKQIGKIIQFFTKPEKIHYKPEDIVVGSVQDSHYILNKIGADIPNFYIPEGAEFWAGREVRKSTIAEVKEKKKEGVPFFIKPVKTKEFPAQVVDKFPLMTYQGQTLHNGMECWLSKVINFVSEYRIFVIEKEIVGCQYYLGDFSIFPSWQTIESAVESIESQPAGWCLDFGVDDFGRTLLIEANDGYAIGDYGLYPSVYAKLLEKRWKELVKGAK